MPNMGRSENKTILRQTSTSSTGNSTASPKGRLNFFKKWPSASGSSGTPPTVHREDSGSSDHILGRESSHQSDKVLTSTFLLPELESSRSHISSPDSVSTGPSQDSDYSRLCEHVRTLRRFPSSSDPKRVDALWDQYRRSRDDALHICLSLMQKAQNNARNGSIETSVIGPFDIRSSFSPTILETSFTTQLHDRWIQAINEYKSAQEFILEDIRSSLLATYRVYEPGATDRHLELFLEDKLLRKSLIIKWRDASVHRLKSEKPIFWQQFTQRSQNYDRLRQDIHTIERLFIVADDEEAPELAIREYVIAKTGDTILEFPNAGPEPHPILRFRVSSHLLSEASPLFAHIFSPGHSQPLDMINQLPPAPSRHTCKDGMEVKVFRMPQLELNKEESLTIMLHAAHMHKSKVPQDIDFSTFVSVAEVCLKYKCTSPLEIYVEYIWLPQWEKKIADDKDDGLLLISYVFGIQGFFTRMSKSAILNAVDDQEIQSKEHWPQVVRDRIKHTRAAKIAQLTDCCTNAMHEYFRPLAENVERPTLAGSLQMTTTPRCPRGSHLCDATNLGWLMLVFNELRVLPTVLNASEFLDMPRTPRRSLKELVDCMRLMPSAPQVHSGICDYAPAFRSAINDIYNSVSGLSLRDVSGVDGWALSKHRSQVEENFGFGSMEMPVEPRESKLDMLMSNADVSLNILSSFERLEDLNAAAMISRSFYNAYKRNEAELLKNIMKAERKRTMSSQTGSALLKTKSRSSQARRKKGDPGQLELVVGQEPEDVKYMVPNGTSTPPPPFEDSGGEDLYDESPPFSPMTYGGVVMSHEEVDRILYGDAPVTTTNAAPAGFRRGAPIEHNHKCLKADMPKSDIEGKARMADGEKHLRDEKDKAMGLGIHKK